MLASIVTRADTELEAAHRAHVQMIVLQVITPRQVLPLAQLPWIVLGAVLVNINQHKDNTLVLAARLGNILM